MVCGTKRLQSGVGRRAWVRPVRDSPAAGGGVRRQEVAAGRAACVRRRAALVRLMVVCQEAATGFGFGLGRRGRWCDW